MKPLTRIARGRSALNRGLACAVLVLATGVSSRVQADGGPADSERANLLFKKGKIAYNAGKFSDALRIYSEAWSLKQSPDIAANLAQTELEFGKHRDAAEHFAFALAHLLPSSTDEQRTALAQGLEQEKKEVASLHVTLEPADSTLTIDEQPVVVPANGDIFLDPGEHRAAVNHEGYTPSQQSVRVSKGSAQVLWIKLQPSSAAALSGAGNLNGNPSPNAKGTPPTAPGAPPLERTEPADRSIVPAIVGGGLVAAGAVVGVVFLSSANSSQKDADALRGRLAGVGTPNACAANTPYANDCSALHSKNSDVDRARAIEVVGFAAAGAAAVGTALYLVWPRSTSSAASSGWAPTVALTPRGGRLGLSAQF